jgi:hypothetical protein
MLQDGSRASLACNAGADFTTAPLLLAGGLAVLLALPANALRVVSHLRRNKRFGFRGATF